eukprot:CAMPEP_0114246212 /NCGR_PEP_ID=MMETSP0058-20121206/12331_1 /TAXON_ID=36894 /ORGANISM="Pyramimonas parkeae, CCMP726" /LENGTH=166 /DNA_ID=CAMNT_0001359361 /DNA_START=36 /DNA_END=536 /DNA_ORIENTATION=+
MASMSMACVARPMVSPTPVLAARGTNFSGAKIQTTVRTQSVNLRANASCSRHTLMQNVDKQSMKPDLMDFRIGHEVKVGVTVKEGQKTRVQPYQGVIIATHKAGLSSTVTVRKMVQGIGVERVFPTHSPLCFFESVPGAGTPKVRRAKLYYLRELKGKSARLKIKY